MDKEKRTRCAVQIANDPNMLAFIEEMFVPTKPRLKAEAEKNIIALSDEDYGRAMKIFYVERTSNLAAIEQIKQIGKTPNLKDNRNALA